MAGAAVKIRFHRDARQSSAEVGGIKVPYAPARRVVSKWRWYLILTCVAAPLLVLMTGLLGRSMSLTADGQLVLERFDLRAAAAGYVTQLNVALQSKVSRGAALVRLRDPALDSTEARLRAELDSRRKSTVPVISVTLAERALSFQRQRHQAIADLFRAGAATAAELGEATATLQRAEEAALDRRNAAAASVISSAPNAREQRSVIAQLAELQHQRERLTAKSPRRGSVLDVYVAQGEYVTPGERLLTIGNTDLPVIQVYVAPRMLANFEAGAAATVRLPDGTRVNASLQQLPATVNALPGGLPERDSARAMAVRLVVQDRASLPRELLIDGLPVRVRFHYPWERNTAGSLIGRALAWLSGYG